MPKAIISKKELEYFVGKKFSKNELYNALLQYLKSDPEEIKGDEWEIKFEDTNRPDLWSVEGLARALRALYGLKQKKYSVKEGDFKVIVDKAVLKIRPFIACAVVKGISLDDKGIKSLIQAQDKLDTTYGRKRKKTSIGIYDFDRIVFPVNYKAVNPDKVKFVPLNFEREITLREILELHPKGQQYGHLISSFSKFPLLIDSEGNVLSMPPIINSNFVGKVDESSKNLFIEVTGTDEEAVKHVLNLMASILAERGGKIYSVKIEHPSGSYETPSFEPSYISVNLDFLEKRIGLNFTYQEVKALLSKFDYKVKSYDKEKRELLVEIPFYRKDILHQVDVIEDVAIAYGYDKIEPLPLKIPSQGGLLKDSKEINKIRELIIGAGFQEILNFDLTSEEVLFDKMLKEREKVVTLKNPVNNNYTCLRNSLLPLSLQFLSRNNKVEFPQKVFEVGDVVKVDESNEENYTSQEKHLCISVTYPKANYTDIKMIFDTLNYFLNWALKVEPAEDSSFIEGRCAKIICCGKEIGKMGEIHPQVLENFGIENPVVSLEINLSDLYGWKKRF